VTPADLVQGLRDGGMPFADDDPDYCPVHAWDHSYIGNLYHEDECPAYAAHLTRLIP
jgi:hypothetical protein